MSLSPEARSEMGQRGRAYAAREFDRNMIMSRIERMLQSLARP